MGDAGPNMYCLCLPKSYSQTKMCTVISWSNSEVRPLKKQNYKREKIVF